MTAVLVILVLILIWFKGCCFKRVLSGVLCATCSMCGCRDCPMCGKKQTCENCPTKDPDHECKCPPCKKYKCELKEAFRDAETYRMLEGLEDVKVEKVPAGVIKKPTVEVKKPEIAKTVPVSVAKQIKPQVKVKVPPCPACNCPSCPTTFGAAPYTYYPIYQPMPYGVRY